MKTFRMMMADMMEDEAELSALLKNGTGAGDDEVQRPERGLRIVSREDLVRRLQSRDARDRNVVNHVSVLYRNRIK